MLKFLLILFLVGYVVFRTGGVIFRLLFSGLNQSRPGNFNSQSYQREKKKAPGSNLNIDHIPKNKQRRKGDDSGEYVDFEEVK